jgi:hypothetical protein
MGKEEFAFYQIHFYPYGKEDILPRKENYTCFAIFDWFGTFIIPPFFHFVNLLHFFIDNPKKSDYNKIE